MSIHGFFVNKLTSDLAKELFTTNKDMWIRLYRPEFLLLSLEDFVCYVIKRIQTNDNFEYFTGFF